MPVLEPVQMNQLFDAYIASRKIVGKHMDGARRWQSVIEDLTGFLKHSDARRITKRNLIDWRDSLLASNKSAKTVADVYLACVRSLLKWAFDNDRLPTNEAESVRQAVPKKVMLRERGYTTSESEGVLQASISYRSVASKNASNQERKPVSDAKRWIPLLCAVTGARVVEMAQLRKDDVRGGRQSLGSQDHPRGRLGEDG